MAVQLCMAGAAPGGTSKARLPCVCAPHNGTAATCSNFLCCLLACQYTPPALLCLLHSACIVVALCHFHRAPAVPGVRLKCLCQGGHTLCLHLAGTIIVHASYKPSAM